MKKSNAKLNAKTILERNTKCKKIKNNLLTLICDNTQNDELMSMNCDNALIQTMKNS